MLNPLGRPPVGAHILELIISNKLAPIFQLTKLTPLNLQKKTNDIFYLHYQMKISYNADHKK